MLFFSAPEILDHFSDMRHALAVREGFHRPTIRKHCSYRSQTALLALLELSLDTVQYMYDNPLPPGGHGSSTWLTISDQIWDRWVCTT